MQIWYFILSGLLECTDITTANACAAASLAPSGIATVTFPAASAGAAIITLVAQAPNTKVKVACPTITSGSGITVKEVSTFGTMFIQSYV